MPWIQAQQLISRISEDRVVQEERIFIKVQDMDNPQFMVELKQKLRLASTNTKTRPGSAGWTVLLPGKNPAVYWQFRVDPSQDPES